MLLALPCDIEDRYTILAEIGRGSHAIVYRATDRLLGRDVAVKVLRPELVDSDVSERFKREIRLTSQLAHPNIAHVYGTGEFQGAPYFVIELARGRSLAERLETEKQLPVDDALAIVRQVASALGHAHRAGIIHRDVKPANILLTPDGALLTDFGVARAIESAAGTLATSTGTAVGTLLYMSPEQLCAEKGIDARSDQYELALVLYELLAGVPPHVAANAEGLRGLRIIGQHVPVRAHRPSVPVSVEQAIDRALCPTPADRFASMAEFVTAMDGGVAASGGMRASASHGTAAALDAQASASASASGAVRRPGSVRRWLAPAVAVGALAAAAVLAAPRIARARTAGPVAAETGTLLAPRFQVAAIGDTARSAPIARALVEELSAWPLVEAEVGGRGSSGSATRLETRVTNVGDGTQVTVQLRNGPTMRAVQVLLPTRGAPDADSVRILAARLLMAGTVSPDSGTALHGVRGRPTAAVRQYGQGWAALLRGDLGAAEQSFAEAARATSVPQAALWRAIVGNWRQPTSAAVWRDAAVRAAEVSASLNQSDSLLAVALQLAATDHVDDACAAFARATRVGGGSFAAWYGLGGCLYNDSIVVTDAASPTGHRFRSSHWSALNAYDEAINRLPSTGLVRLFERLPRIAMAPNGSVRRGYKPSGSGGTYAGFASLAGDSTVVLPIAMGRFATGGRAVVPATYQSATRVARARVLRMTAAIARRAPGTFAAQFAYARALELAGVLQSTAGEPTALGLLAMSAALARSPADSLDVATAQVRVWLRLGDFAAAHRSATRLLRSGTHATADAAERVAVVSLLVNQSTTAESLYTRVLAASEANPDGLPPRIAASVARYHVSAASTECRGAPIARAAAISALRARFSPNELAGAISKWITPADWAALSCSGAALPADLGSDNSIARALTSLAAGDRAAASRILRERAERRSGASESTLSWDTRQLEIALLLRAADTTSARQAMTIAFEELSGTMDFVLYDYAQVAGLRRALHTCAALTTVQPIAPQLTRCRVALAQLDGTL